MATDRLKKKIGVGRHHSSIKRARQTEKTRERNRTRTSRMRTAVKAARANPGADELKKAMPLVMKTAQKGNIHRNKASRLVSRLTRQANAQNT